MQDVGGKENTELSEDDLTRSERELSVESLGDCQPVGRRPPFSRPVMQHLANSGDSGETNSVDKTWLAWRAQQQLATEPKMPMDHSQKLAAQEKEMIEAAFRESGGRVFGPSGAATKLGIARCTLESKIRSLNISKYRFKTAPAF